MTAALLTAPDITDATRREFLAGLTAAGLLAGCTADPTPDPAAPGAAGYPRTIRHDGGESVLDAPPTRVISLDAKGITDPLIALGIAPTGAVSTGDEFGGFGAPLRGRTDDIEIVGTNAEPNLEAIAALAPDLLVGFEFSFAEALDQLRALAPVVVFADDRKWHEIFDSLATVFDRRAEHDVWIARIDAGVEQVRATAAGTSVAVITPLEDGSFFLSGPAYDTSALLVDAGVEVATLPGLVDEFGSGAFEVSGERLGEITSEHIVVVTYQEDLAQQVNLLEDSPLWPTLPAVQTGNVHVIDGGSWNNFGPIALVAMLDEAAQLLGS